MIPFLTPWLIKKYGLPLAMKLSKVIAVLIAVVVAVLIGWYICHSLIQVGVRRNDAAWVAKYNEAIQGHNKAVKALEDKTKEMAEQQRASIAAKDAQIDAIKDEFDLFKTNVPRPRSIVCPKAEFNSDLPPKFVEIWNRFNATTTQVQKAP